MKNRALFLLLAATALTSSPAFAAPVFMLQFGSFETRAEAEDRLTKLKSEHGGVIGNLPTGIREVTLPPDNLTVYRTQAGPLETRASAQSVCSQLASNGDECYVVETAMAPSFTPSNTQVAQASPPPAATPTLAPAMSSAPSPSMPAPMVTNKNDTADNANIGNPAEAPNAAPPVAMKPLPGRDPENVAAINRATAPAPAAAKPAPQTSPAMVAAMDEAATEQDQREKEIAAAPTPPGAKKEGSFWSRLNPFSSDDEMAAAPPPKPPAPVAAPVELVETTPAPVLAPAPAPMPAPARLSPLPQASAVPVLIVPPPAPPAPMLPPPPPPLVGKGSIAANSTAASLRAPAPVIVPEPTGTIQGPPPIVIADAPQARANVRVGEAQRVPLTQATVPPPMLAPPAMMPPSAPPMSLRPSATLGEKTLWAQVGQFRDAQAALAFWDQYRRGHPDFPVVRVRVTSPYMAVTHGYDQVSLRVGPFAKQDSIRNLCTTVGAEPGSAMLHCGSVVDMGISSIIGGPKNGYLPGSRYQR